ncbi:MAG TPA: hypothetical protein VMP11_14265 [Verrucomicrobiae bacterium]|nr:hypothetical protein [Verrucomicrobiae bacterium]
MYALILAAILSFEQTMPEFEAFCSNAEIEVNSPITPEAVKCLPSHHEDEVRIHIGGRYRIECLGGKVRVFQDLQESGKRKLNHLDPAEMQRWSEQPCLIDETGAKEIATRLFKRMGFDEKRFGPVEVHRYTWQPSEANPEHVLRLPLFWVNWQQKQFLQPRQFPPAVQMDISATTRKLVNYEDWTDDDRPLIGLLEGLQPLQRGAAATTNGPPVSPTTATPVEHFFGATGIKPSKDWRQQTQATDPSPPTFVQVEDRYLFRLQVDSVREFCDSKQQSTVMALKRDSTGLDNLSGVATAVTETQAVQIAGQLFGRLGFDERAFNPAEVKHIDDWRQDPAHPQTMQTLPTSYSVRWVGKRPPPVRSGLPDVIEMEISGANSNLVHYWYAPNTFRY